MVQEMLDVFIDTEFNGLRQNTKLLSIGATVVVGDLTSIDRIPFGDTTFSGKPFLSFYAETIRKSIRIDPWVAKNVEPYLMYNKNGSRKRTFSSHPAMNCLQCDDTLTNKSSVVCCGDNDNIAGLLKDWLAAFNLPIRIWSDTLAYDWVLFCELFGGARNLPEFINYIPMDIATLFWICRIDPDINREEFIKEYVNYFRFNPVKHNALWDAQCIALCQRKLMKRLTDTSDKIQQIYEVVNSLHKHR